MFLPTGVYVQSVEFTSANDVAVSGLLWQNCGQARAEADGDVMVCATEGEPFVFPEAIDQTLRTAYVENEGHETEDAANAAGFQYFVDAERFREYVRKELLVLESVAA